MAELLNEARLRAALGARPFRFYSQIGSTNDAARHWAQSGAPTGAVVVAEEQIAGRGRFERRWLAAPDTALLFSVILRPGIHPERLPRVAILGALAVAEALDALHLPSVTLKWPNDVHLAGRKAAGVLPEADWQNDQLSALALGIGINVRTDFSNTPLANKAISIESAEGEPVDRALLLAQTLRRIDGWSVRISSTELIDAWRVRLETLGQRVTATGINSQPIYGIAVDVDAEGALLLQTEENVIHRVIAGEVTLSDRL